MVLLAARCMLLYALALLAGCCRSVAAPGLMRVEGRACKRSHDAEGC